VRTRHPLIALGAAVRTARQASGLSQEKCGELAGLHRNEIGALERGEHNVSFLNLLRVCGAVRVRPSDLLRGFEVPKVSELPNTRAHSKHREK